MATLRSIIPPHQINQITGAIVSSAMHVHSVLGPGLLESCYQGCLALGYRVDLIVEGMVIVEVKSVEGIHPVHQAQLLSYMRLSKIGVGLLINFYVTHLRDGIKRMVDGENWEK